MEPPDRRPLRSSSEPLVTRLVGFDLSGWAQLAAWMEELELSVEDVLLLAAIAMNDGASSVSELASVSELGSVSDRSLDWAYRAIHDLHRRGYLREERRSYSLSTDGQMLVSTLEAAHRGRIQAYVDQLGPCERQRLAEALGMT